MNRRSFLSRLGMGIAVAAVAPTALFTETPVCMAAPVAATIGEYYDYANFSSFAIASALDECVGNAAKELGNRASLNINEMWQSQLA